MPGILNKQPIFTSKPILLSQTFDVQRYTYSIENPAGYATPTVVFTATDDYGTLIERITVSTCASNDYPNISQRWIYVFIYDPNADAYSLYKSAIISADTISFPKLNPEIEWAFQGGLLLPAGYKIAFGASDNANNSGNIGDYLAITIEGSSYSQP